MPSPTSRDDGLRRVGSITRWVVGGSLVLTGAFAAVVAHAVPGRAATSTDGTGGASATTVPPSPTPTDGSGSASSGSASGGATQLSPPVQAPTPVQQPANVRSGGS